MSKKKITYPAKKLILKEKHKAPYLGVRALAELLVKKYNFKLSKSTIHNILKQRGLRDRFGRKKALLVYQKKELGECGLFLLRCLGEQLGVFSYLTEELKVYFPRLEKELLRVLITVASLSALEGRQLPQAIHQQSFLRIIGRASFPLRKLHYFTQTLSQEHPIVGLDKLKQAVQPVFSIKFYFNNNYQGFCDAKMTTLWDSPCEIAHFSSPLQAVKLRIEQMLKESMLLIGYTKSFDYFSPLFFNFVNAIKSGLRKIQLLNARAQVLEEMPVHSAKIALLIGYYPEILAKGMAFSDKTGRFNRLFWEELGEVFSLIIPTKLLQHKENKEVIIANVLLKLKPSTLPAWGILTNLPINSKKNDLLPFLKKYLYYFSAYLDSAIFKKDMEIIEKSLWKDSQGQDYLSRMIPQKLRFSQDLDFIRVGQLLSAIFKEIVWGWEPKRKKGIISPYKNAIGVFIKNTPLELRLSFNSQHFFINGKKVFLM